MSGLEEGGYKRNPGLKVKCMACDNIIQSMYRHDFKWCPCGTIAVDGGGDYLKMSYNPGAKYIVIHDQYYEDQDGIKGIKDYELLTGEPLKMDQEYDTKIN